MKTRLQLVKEYEEQLESYAVQNRMTVEELIELAQGPHESDPVLDTVLKIIERIKALSVEH